MTDDETGNGSKRARVTDPRGSDVGDEDFDQVIAKIVAVIEDETKMLGELFITKTKSGSGLMYRCG